VKPTIQASFIKKPMTLEKLAMLSDYEAPKTRGGCKKKTNEENI